MAENNGLAFAPVFVINFCSVFGRDGAHKLFSLFRTIRFLQSGCRIPGESFHTIYKPLTDGPISPSMIHLE
jgi:hypothetical protein